MADLSRISEKASRATRLHRRQAEQIVELAQHLPRADALLIEQVYKLGIPVAQIALVAAKPAHLINRRVHKLLKRLNDPVYRHLIAFGDLLPREIRHTAELITVQGCTLRQAATRRGVSLHTIRKQMIAVRALAGDAA